MTLLCLNGNFSTCAWHFGLSGLPKVLPVMVLVMPEDQIVETGRESEFKASILGEFGMVWIERIEICVIFISLGFETSPKTKKYEDFVEVNSTCLIWWNMSMFCKLIDSKSFGFSGSHLFLEMPKHSKKTHDCWYDSWDDLSGVSQRNKGQEANRSCGIHVLLGPKHHAGGWMGWNGLGRIVGWQSFPLHI